MKRVGLLLLSALFLLSPIACGQGAPSSDTGGQEKPRAEEKSADYSALYDALGAVPGDLSAYTAASAAAMQAAVSSVRYGLKASAQAEVDGYTAAVLAAIADLKERQTFASLQAIIDYVDSLGMDFDNLAGFSMDGYFEDAVLKETPDAGQAYADETVYIGDSITLYMHRYAPIPSGNIYGVGSINPQNACEDAIATLQNGQKATFAAAMRERQPKRMVVTIGTNSMLMDSYEYLRYFALFIEQLKAACPSAQILIQSTSPLTASYERGMRLLTNKRLNYSNMLLAGLAVYEGVYFLNSAAALKGADGTLSAQYDLGEGYGHINAAAYDVWIAYLRTHAAPTES